MVLWHTELRVSWRTQWFSLALHSFVILGLLLSSWPMNMMLIIWLILLLWIIFSLVSSQRRIRQTTGQMVLHDSGQMSWQGNEWRLAGKPWMLQSGLILFLRPLHGGTRRRLWIAADAMSEGEWRDLRRELLQVSGTVCR